MEGKSDELKSLEEMKAFLYRLKDAIEFWLETGKEPDSGDIVNLVCDIAGETGNHLHLDYEDDIVLNKLFLSTLLDHIEEMLKNISSIDEAGLDGEPALKQLKDLCNLSALVMIETYDSNRDVFSWFGLHQDNMKYLKNALRRFSGVEVPAWELLRYAQALYTQEVFENLVEKILKKGDEYDRKG